MFLPAGIQILTVSDLTRDIKVVLEDTFPSVWVEGEVSNFKPYSSGHWYFSLKDQGATVSAAIWKGINSRIRFQLTDGLHVVAHGRLDVYAPRGSYTFIVDQIQPKGIGPLELAFQQLKEKLLRLGLFEPARKKPLPPVPRRVAIVTSASGSAIRDMLETLGRRWPAVELWVRPVRVQGDGAALEIAAAIALFNRIAGPGSATPIDVLLVGRGGGSLEDLWAFNEEPVALAIAASLIPVVTGIGHEDDYTIADMVADFRGLTPTDAATRIVPDRQEQLRLLFDQLTRMRNALLRQLDQKQRRLADLAGRRCFRQPLERIRDQERRLDELSERLTRAARERLEKARQKAAVVAGRLESLSPLNVLARGYSLTRKELDQAVVRREDEVRPGERIVTVLSHGRLVSRVEESVVDDPAS